MGNLVREAKSNLIFSLKTRLPFLYIIIFGSKKMIFSTFKKGEESSIIKKKNIAISEFKNSFFGYYDVSPFHPKEEHLMVFLANDQSPYFKPDKKHKSAIILYNLDNGQHQVLDSCNAWNWQQGNRLQWLNDDEVIYNDFIIEKQEFVAKILNVKTGIQRVIERPFQAVYKQEYFLGIDYNALHKIKSEYAYQYCSAKAETKKIVKYDFMTATFSDVITIEEVRHFLGLPETVANKSEHINHILISPDGDFFIFIYRYSDRNKRHDFLLGYDMHTGTLHSLVRDEMISHCTWKDNKNFVFWGIIAGKKGYFSCNINAANPDLIWPCTRDGHPTILPDNIILTDTYPGGDSFQMLKAINIDQKKEKVLATVYHPPFFELHTRCDLHPSISKSGRFIQVDTLSKKRREIVVFEYEPEKVWK